MLSEIHDESVMEDAGCVFLGEVVSQDNAHGKVELKVDGEKVQFKMDTEADETCLPFSISESMKKNFPVLKKSKKKLYSCDGKSLNVCGKFTATIEGDKKIAIQDVYVIKGLHQALLGGPAIRVLNLLMKTNLVEAVYSSEVEAKLHGKWKNASFRNLFVTWFLRCLYCIMLRCHHHRSRSLVGVCYPSFSST